MKKHPRDLDTSSPKSNKNKRQSRLQSAIDNAAAYHDEVLPDEAASDNDDVRPMEEWGDIVTQRIEDAIRQGHFDNLAGKGKPLNLNRDPFLPEDQQMAATLLKNNKLSPEWISERSAILDAIQSLRADLRKAALSMNDQCPDMIDGELSNDNPTWSAYVDRWRERMEHLNQRILVHNLKQPISHLEILQLRLRDELSRATNRSDT